MAVPSVLTMRFKAGCPFEMVSVCLGMVILRVRKRHRFVPPLVEPDQAESCAGVVMWWGPAYAHRA